MVRLETVLRRRSCRALGATALVALMLIAARASGEDSPATRREPTRRGTKAPVLRAGAARPLGSTVPTPLSPEILRQRERTLGRTHRPGPPVPRPPANARRSSPPEPPASPPTTPSPGGAAPPQGAGGGVELLESIDLFNVLDEAGLSTTLEPSVAVKGGRVLMTGNWFAAFSDDGGESFAFADPYQEPFGPPEGQSFCCDQVTIYDPRSNAFFWLQQYSAPGDAGNVQRINVDVGADGAFDCDYDFTAADFDLPADYFIDFPDLQLGDAVLYATTNSYDSGDEAKGGGKFQKSVVYRMPLDAIGSCESIDFAYHSSVDFNARVAAGTGSVGYWAYHAYGDAGARFLRIASWPEGTGSVDLRDVAITLPADAQYGDYRCPGPDGTDMCAFSGSRLLGAYRSGDELGFFWNEPQGGPYPYPYVATARIRARDGALLAQAAIWNPDFAWTYPSVAPNSRGEIGGTIALGGGSRDPSCAAWTSSGDIDSSFDSLVVVKGDAGPESNRWGDYLTSRRNPDRPTTWDGTCFALFGGQTQGSSHPIFVEFARSGGSGGSKGTTLTPDELTFLVNKDVGDERWAISLHTIAPFGGAPIVESVTGNVYFPGGGDPRFVYCVPSPGSEGTVNDPESVFSFACYGADACTVGATECAFLSWGLISANVELAASFFLPPGGFSGAASTRPPGSATILRRPMSAGSRRAGAPRPDDTILAAGRGSTLTPDELHFLTSKDVGEQRWAISLSYVPAGEGFDLEDVTGNVYFPDGRPPQFVYCTPNPGQTGTVDDPASTFRFSCFGADACTDTALDCAATGWSVINGEVTLQASFFLPPGGL